MNSFSMVSTSASELRQHSVVHYKNIFGAVSNAQYVMYHLGWEEMFIQLFDAQWNTSQDVTLITFHLVL